MDNYKNSNIMVLDTEYETNPKRLISLSYIIYQYKGEECNKIKINDYIKYAPEVFSVDENGEAFQFHQLSNDFLQENGISLEESLEKFNSNLNDIGLLIGQNILSADIQALRKEAIGINLWFGEIREKIKNVNILDTMMAFREKNPELKSSLDSIYKFLFDKDMKNHHDSLQDCKNTFKCFEKMVELNYSFKSQKLKFPEEIFEEVMKESKKCSICESKVPEDNSLYKYANNILETEDKIVSICNSFLKKDDEICKKCLGNVELLMKNKDGEFLDLVKLKVYDSYIKEFFEILGDEEITVYLTSSYKEKDEIKKLGGRWDGRVKSWYFTYNQKSKQKIEKFKKWIASEE